jgi:uncharacterized protein
MPYEAYRVKRKTKESELISSFELCRVDDGKLAAFLPGQYLTIRLPDEVVRTYTISSAPHEAGHYRISVKREPDGRGSAFLHDSVQEGDLVEVYEPRGEFFLDESRQSPVVLLSGGVGITPMVSMLHALSATERVVTFIHACESGAAHAFRSEVDRITRLNPNARCVYLYRTPSLSDRETSAFHHEGMLSSEILKGLVAVDSADCYLCGPPGFMKAVYASLRALGVGKERIFFEFFGPSTLLETAPEPLAPSAPDETRRVTFARSGDTVEWSSSDETILELAERHGLAPDSGCRVGVCNSCQCRLVKGTVNYIEEPLEMPPAGYALICISKPASDEVVLDI